MAVVPGLFTSQRPDATACCPASTPGPTGGAIFGYDFQGCDVYARAVYGARASLLVGALLGAVHRASSRWSSGCSPATSAAGSTRCSPGSIDIVLGIPLLLAAIVLLKRVGSDSASGTARRGHLRAGGARLDHRRPGRPVLGDHRQAAGLRGRGPDARAPATAGSCGGTSCRTRSPR